MARNKRRKNGAVNTQQHPETPTPEALGRLPDHTSTADLKLMHDAILNLTGPGRLFFAVRVVELNLMAFRAENEEVQMALDFILGLGQTARLARLTFETHPEALDGMIEATADHCLNGTDPTDPTSAGGWNKDEVALAYAQLFVARRGLTVPFGANVQ